MGLGQRMSWRQFCLHEVETVNFGNGNHSIYQVLPKVPGIPAIDVLSFPFFSVSCSSDVTVRDMIDVEYPSGFHKHGEKYE